jgi:ABC-type sugar transport system ATPase subunit
MQNNTVEQSINISPENTILEMTGIFKSYSGVHALVDAQFSCRKSEVHALLGENGAGKSTLVKILAGVIKCDNGTIRLNGNEIYISSPIEAEKHGISAVFQELSLVPTLSVSENIFLGREPRSKLGMVDFKKMGNETQNILDDLGLKIDSRETVSELPHSKQQLVEIVRAISRKPQILILDEATSALGEAEVKILFELIKKQVQKGVSVLFISHRMSEITDIADFATIYRDAHYITTFKMGTVNNSQIVNWIAGRDIVDIFPPRQTPLNNEVVMELQGLNVQDSLYDINVKVHKGEILGIAGLQGHGQNELLLTLFGVMRITKGKQLLNNKPVSIRCPKDAIRAGLVLVPIDRKTGGLVLNMSMRENLTAMVFKHLRIGPIISKYKEMKLVQQAVQKLNIKASSTEQLVLNLSGGNQQKVVMGKTLLANAKILLLGDPTRGIDVGTKTEIYKLLRTLSEDGVTILFLSTEINELVGLCDNVLVFREGRIVSEIGREQLNEQSILQASLGISSAHKNESINS